MLGADVTWVWGVCGRQRHLFLADPDLDKFLHGSSLVGHHARDRRSPLSMTHLEPREHLGVVESYEFDMIKYEPLQ